MSDILNVTKDAEDNAGNEADDFQAMTILRSLLGKKQPSRKWSLALYKTTKF